MKSFKVFSPVDITVAISTSQLYCFIVGDRKLITFTKSMGK